ncbi:glycosyltransferase [Variovorax guangxiensis]|nr:glycosyltransferase [Variovorax guangxiensis]
MTYKEPTASQFIFDLNPERKSLAEIFQAHDGNLSDKWEQYLSIYEMVLAPRVAQNRPLHLLEIGVQNGGSLQIWSKYLPSGSTVTGIDIDPACANLSLGDLIQIHIGDASSEEELTRLLGEKTFDIIVDDGSHRSDHIIATFKACFGRLNHGGAFIIEDLHASYVDSLGGGFHQPKAAVEWLKALIDAVNIDYLNSVEADALSQIIGMNVRELGVKLARVSFYDSVAVIEAAQEMRENKFRRVMGGKIADVSRLERQIKSLPPSQLRSLILNPSALEVFGSRLLEELTETNERLKKRELEKNEIEELARSLTSEVNELSAAKMEALDAERGLKNEIRQLNSRLGVAGKISEDLRRQVAEIENRWRTANGRAEHAENEHRAAIELVSRAEEFRQASLEQAFRAEQELHAVRTSTTWKAMTLFGPRVPSPLRTTIRRAAKLTWWVWTGQVRTKLETWLRSRAENEVADPKPEATMAEATMAAKDIAVSGSPSVLPSNLELSVQDRYEQWQRTHTASASTLFLQNRIGRAFKSQPIFSILVPAFKTPLDVFCAMIQSVLEQSYEKWQLCLVIVDESGHSKELVRVAEDLAKKDSRFRVKVLAENLGISGNSNAALELVAGDWVVLLDHDDELSRDALFELARAANANPDLNFIYSDKDMLSRDGSERFNPLFKPGWSPDILLNANYLTHVCAIRSDRLREINGWDPSTDGAQDWDLFLRVIDSKERVKHIPKVLYHWRIIETSVSSGGFDVKPYAAQGQIKTLVKYLPKAGWPNAEPKFEDGQIRIQWNASNEATVLLLVCGGEISSKHLSAAEGLNASVGSLQETEELYRKIDDLIAANNASLIILVDAGFQPAHQDSLRELIAPMSNPLIAMTAGRVISADGTLLEFGTFIRNGHAYPAFRGEPSHYFIPGGSASWYRNASASSAGALAFRRADWKAVGGFMAFAGEGRPDIAFSLAILESQTRGRLLLNPYALFHSAANSSIFERIAGRAISTEFVKSKLPFGDPFLSPAVDIETRPGVPQIPVSTEEQAVPQGHDFFAEARYVASAFDATAAQIRESIKDCNNSLPGPLRSIAWFIPSFTVPFYGGIYTILRAADYMYQRHDVRPMFIVLGDASVEEITARIRLAFPELANSAVVLSIRSVSDPLPALGELDAAVATLWTTAFLVLKLRSVRRKFYFVQDWEPLFYPAGTISAAVEATYRFGFHAICNTPSLASSYSELGGVAEYFMPAIDSAVFHSEGRPARLPNSPFVLVCYARPGTPRNCFEALGEALKKIKDCYGKRVEIVTAGQSWDPAPYGLAGLINNLGLLSYEETGALYRAADAGLVAMATRHPSYLPFELMASGAAVITNRNSTTAWLLRDKENCLLFEMTASDIFEAVSRLIEEPSLRNSLVANARQCIDKHHSSWDGTCLKIFDVIDRVCKTA